MNNGLKKEKNKQGNLYEHLCEPTAILKIFNKIF